MLLSATISICFHLGQSTFTANLRFSRLPQSCHRQVGLVICISHAVFPLFASIPPSILFSTGLPYRSGTWFNRYFVVFFVIFVDLSSRICNCLQWFWFVWISADWFFSIFAHFSLPGIVQYWQNWMSYGPNQVGMAHLARCVDCYVAGFWKYHCTVKQWLPLFVSSSA